MLCAGVSESEPKVVGGDCHLPITADASADAIGAVGVRVRRGSYRSSDEEGEEKGAVEHNVCSEVFHLGVR